MSLLYYAQILSFERALMNYHHSYHAGNFADLFKHSILTILLTLLQRKATALWCLDTHAGIAQYDLGSRESGKTKEYLGGIGRLYEVGNWPRILEPYQRLILALNHQQPHLQYYPGSPLIFKDWLRPQDHLVLVELQAGEMQLLKKAFNHEGQVTIHHTDGYQSLKALLPPKNYGRGLILIDPPFEDKAEFVQLLVRVPIALQHFRSGVYAIWYPIKEEGEVQNFYATLPKFPCSNYMVIEFTIGSKSTVLGLRSCGMVILNAPWQLATELQGVLPWLRDQLAVDQSAIWQISSFEGGRQSGVWTS